MKKSSTLKNIALSGIFAAIIAVSSLIAVPSPVPFTLQVLAVFLTAGILPLGCAFAAVLSYILLGAVGLPIFSGFIGGAAALFGPTGGFILSFIAVPFIFALLGENKLYAKMFVSLIFCYILGSLWYMQYTSAESILAVVTVTVLPFVVPDIIKTVIAVLIIKRLKGRVIF